LFVFIPKVLRNVIQRLTGLECL